MCLNADLEVVGKGKRWAHLVADSLGDEEVERVKFFAFGDVLDLLI